MIRNFEIHNDRLKSVKYPKGVTGNVNTYICHFDIACDIPDLIWFCVFKQGDIVYRQTIENNTCKIPQEVLVNTEPLYIGCYGTNADDDIKRVSTNLIFFDVKEGAYSESTMPDTPTPDVWETLVSKTIPIIGENGNWFVYDMTEDKYVDTGKPSQGGSGGGGDVDLSDYLTEEETKALLAKKEDVSNKITLSQWQDAVDKTQLLNDDKKYISALLALHIHEEFNLRLLNQAEQISRKVYVKGKELDSAPYYSVKATQEYVASAIQSAVLDSWEVEV